MHRPLVLPLIVSTILTGLSASSVSVRADDEAKPAKKDSPKAIKPAQATLTAAVEPAQAKPGDVVTFKVTAKLDSGYHIYKYSKKQGSGPVPTSFDFFGRAGLEVEGEWKASRDAEKHKDPNFADLEFVEYYEDEVTWSIKLKVPDSTAPGKKSLLCQVRYMVCDAKTCSIPGRWTLPDAELTVLEPRCPRTRDGEAGRRCRCPGGPTVRRRCPGGRQARKGRQRCDFQAGPGHVHNVHRAGPGQGRRRRDFQSDGEARSGLSHLSIREGSRGWTAADEL